MGTSCTAWPAGARCRADPVILWPKKLARPPHGRIGVGLSVDLFTSEEYSSDHAGEPVFCAYSR
jgi:hypothetical protein